MLATFFSIADVVSTEALAGFGLTLALILFTGIVAETIIAARKTTR